MKGKFSVIRGEQKLKNVDPAITALYDKKMVKIVKAAEEEAEEAEQVESDLLLSIGKLAIENAKDIIKITEDKGLSLPEEKEENKEENLETLTKSLEEISGVPLKAVIKGRRRRRIE